MDASPQFLYCGMNPLHRPLGTGGGGHMRVCRRGFPSLPRVRRSGAVAVATGPKPSTTLASSPAKSRVPTNGSINGAANRFGNVSDEIKRVRAQMEEDEQLATLMRGLRGQNLSDSQFADENIRLRLVEIVKAIHAVSREQLVRLSAVFGFGNVAPVFSMVPLKPASLLPTITKMKLY